MKKGHKTGERTTVTESTDLVRRIAECLVPVYRLEETRQNVAHGLADLTENDCQPLVETLCEEMSRNGRERAPSTSRSPGGRTASSRLPQVLTDLELESRPNPDWLVKGVIPAGGLIGFYGPSGVGKGFILLDLAHSVATGTNWCDRSVSQGPVVYMAAERTASLCARSKACKERHGIGGSAPVFYILERISLINPESVGAIIEALDSLPTPPALLIIDTLAKTILPGDENSAADMGRYLLGLQEIREKVGCAVLVVHHPGADGRRERGSTALIADADVMISVRRSRSLIRLKCEKMNDAEGFDPIDFQIVGCGESAVAVTPADGVGARVDSLTSTEREVLASLSRDFGDNGAITNEWVAASGVSKTSFYRAIKTLREKGFVDSGGGGRGANNTITPKGKEAINPNSQITPK